MSDRSDLRITVHGFARCRTRGISEEAIAAAIEFGRHRAARGADIYTIGWREVRYFTARGVDLSPWEGVEVVCSHDGDILTTYRNKNPHAMRDRHPVRRAA